MAALALENESTSRFGYCRINLRIILIGMLFAGLFSMGHRRRWTQTLLKSEICELIYSVFS